MREKYMVGGHLLELSTWPKQSSFKVGSQSAQVAPRGTDSRKLILESPAGYPPLLRSQGGPAAMVAEGVGAGADGGGVLGGGGTAAEGSGAAAGRRSSGATDGGGGLGGGMDGGGGLGGGTEGGGGLGLAAGAGGGDGGGSGIRTSE